MPTPQFIKDAARLAMDEGFTFYPENAGLPLLRADLSEYYRRMHDVVVAPSQVLVTASGVQALNVAIRCVIDPGDEALVLTPNWPNASAIVQMFGGASIEQSFVFGGSRFCVDFNALEDVLTPRTRLLVYTSPSNPLGWVATEDDQRRLLAFCRTHGLWLLADEVYERLCYTAPVAPSILKLCRPDDAVLVTQSFSKSYCMTGWRLGWVVSRPDLVEKAAQLNEFIISHAPAMVQRAGQTALREGEAFVAKLVAGLRDRAEFCTEVLSGISGVTTPAPDGAFYLFPRVDGLTDSFDLVMRLLKETHVSVAPGVAFGVGGEGAFRICYAADRAVLDPAMERIARFLKRG